MIARLIYLAILLASLTLLGLGMFFQFAWALEPCSTLVLVRYALVFVALFALAAVGIGAGQLMRIVMSSCIGVISLAGAVVAAHQAWPRHVPLNLSALGVNLDSALRSMPLGDVLPRFFLGAGGCDRARWKILGIAGSEWAFIAFLAFIVAAFIAAQRK